jgi:hypothetical protein
LLQGGNAGISIDINKKKKVLCSLLKEVLIFVLLFGKFALLSEVYQKILEMKAEG